MAVRKNFLFPQDLWNDPDLETDACVDSSVICGAEKGQCSRRSIKQLEFIHPQILRDAAPAERTLPIYLFQFSVRQHFLVSVQSQFDQRLHMQGGSVDFRCGGNTAAGSGRAVCCQRKAAKLPRSSHLLPSVVTLLVYIGKTINYYLPRTRT